jgi:hypothetical protein
MLGMGIGQWFLMMPHESLQHPIQCLEDSNGEDTHLE